MKTGSFFKNTALSTILFLTSMQNVSNSTNINSISSLESKINVNTVINSEPKIQTDTVYFIHPHTYDVVSKKTHQDTSWVTTKQYEQHILTQKMFEYSINNKLQLKRINVYENGELSLQTTYDPLEKKAEIRRPETDKILILNSIN